MFAVHVVAGRAGVTDMKLSQMVFALDGLKEEKRQTGVSTIDEKTSRTVGEGGRGVLGAEAPKDSGGHLIMSCCSCWWASVVFSSSKIE